VADAPVTADTRQERRVVVFSAVILIILLLLDQFTKILVDVRFQLHESIPVIPGWFNLTYERNTGAAWSIFSEHTWLLLLFGLVIGVVVLIFGRRWCEGWRERYWALAMIESGILGNSIDRLWHGAVIDFFHFHYYNHYHYPVFNIADCAIFCGAVIFILSNFFRPEKKKAEQP